MEEVNMVTDSHEGKRWREPTNQPRAARRRSPLAGAKRPRRQKRTIALAPLTGERLPGQAQRSVLPPPAGAKRPRRRNLTSDVGPALDLSIPSYYTIYYITN